MTITDTVSSKVEAYIYDARLVAFDGCHKIYLALDETEAEWFRSSNGYTVVEATPDVMLDQVLEWFDESCFLRFISGVRHNADDPNAGFVPIVEQFETDEEDE